MAGMLPMKEAVEAITDQTFAPLAALSHYERNGAERLQSDLRSLAAYAQVTIGPTDVIVLSSNAASASPRDWAFLRKLREIMPLATVVLRVHSVR